MEIGSNKVKVRGRGPKGGELRERTRWLEKLRHRTWKGWPMWTLGPSELSSGQSWKGVLVSQELGLLEMGQGGKEMGGSWGYLTVRSGREPDGLKITTGGFKDGERKAVVFGDVENP